MGLIRASPEFHFNLIGSARLGSLTMGRVGLDQEYWTPIQL